MTEVIDRILDEFDFEKVLKTMHSLKWEYWDSEGPVTRGELRRMARRLLKDLIASDNYRMGCGGFEAEKHVFEEVTTITLRFVVAEWEEEI